MVVYVARKIIDYVKLFFRIYAPVTAFHIAIALFGPEFFLRATSMMLVFLLTLPLSWYAYDTFKRLTGKWSGAVSMVIWLNYFPQPCGWFIALIPKLGARSTGGVTHVAYFLSSMIVSLICGFVILTAALMHIGIQYYIAKVRGEEKPNVGQCIREFINSRGHLVVSIISTVLLWAIYQPLMNIITNSTS